MSWYDWFASFYDTSLETLYAEARESSANALELGSAKCVLDLPTGTGQGFDSLLARLPPDGKVIGVDLSAGMLEKAKKRVRKNDWETRVSLIEADVHSLEVRAFDRLHVFLGLTVFPRYEEAFNRLWKMLEPGGRVVVVDTYAAKPGPQGRFVNWVAGADIRRPVWEPLERVCEDFERVEMKRNWKHGGQLWLSRGRKPH